MLTLPVLGTTSCVPTDPGEDTCCACVLCSGPVVAAVPSCFPDLVFIVLPSAASCEFSKTLDSATSMLASELGAAAATSLSASVSHAAAAAAAACMPWGVTAAPRLNLTDLLVLLALPFFALLPCGAASVSKLLAGDLVVGAEPG